MKQNHPLLVNKNGNIFWLLEEYIKTEREREREKDKEKNNMILLSILQFNSHWYTTSVQISIWWGLSVQNNKEMFIFVGELKGGVSKYVGFYVCVS